MERKIKVIFTCHGNICRSPMGEYIFKKLVSDEGLEDKYEITSAGVSSEEQGNDIYPPAKRTLRSHGITFGEHYAHRITDKEFDDSDVVVALDRSNERRLVSRFGDDPKIQMLLERDVDDPWYTDDFETAYRDILRGCRELLSTLENS